MAASTRPISDFVDRHFLHFNAATLKDATDAYTKHIDSGGVMFMTLAGAMSTAELGISLAEMIRRDKVQAMRRIERLVIDDWIASDQKGERYFPHEFMYRLIRSGKLKPHYEIDPADSWL